MSSTLDRRGKRIAAAVAAMGGFALLAAAPAQAQSSTSAVCTVTFPVISITPPFSPFVLTPASGTVTSNGPTGTVSCVGEIGGDQVMGPGTGALLYAYSNGTCVAHVGLGTVNWTIPTAAGPTHLTGTLSVRRIGVSVLAEVRFSDARADLAGALVPLQGDCVLAPLRKVRVMVAGAFLET